MIYKIINPSDALTIEANDNRIAAVVGILLGEGQIAVDDENGDQVLPIFAFSAEKDFLDWCEKAGIGDLAVFVKDNTDAVVQCLESVVYGSFRDRKALHAALHAALQDISNPEEKRTAILNWNDDKRSSMNDFSTRACEMADHLKTSK